MSNTSDNSNGTVANPKPTDSVTSAQTNAGATDPNANSTPSTPSTAPSTGSPSEAATSPTAASDAPGVAQPTETVSVPPAATYPPSGPEYIDVPNPGEVNQDLGGGRVYDPVDVAAYPDTEPKIKN